MHRMGNTPTILCPRCKESDESHLHFIFHCKLSQNTLNFINRLINENSKFQSPFKVSIKDILMGLFYKIHDDVRLEISPILIEVFIGHSSFCRRKAFYGDGSNKINELDNYKRNLISRFETIRDKAMELGSKESFLKKWKFLLERKKSHTIQFS